MMGLMVVMVFVFYLLISIWAVYKTIEWARTNNRKPWLWGGVMTLVMYNLVFWDLIPTLVIHKYFCDTQAGFWVYKTPEQWKKENPNMRLLSYHERSSNDFKVIKTTDGGNETSFTVNRTSKIKYKEQKHPVFFLTKNRRVEESLYDDAQKTYLARKITYEAGHPFGAPKKLTHYKFWINLKQCAGNNGNASQSSWQNSINEFMKFGE